GHRELVEPIDDRVRAVEREEDAVVRPAVAQPRGDDRRRVHVVAPERHVLIRREALADEVDGRREVADRGDAELEREPPAEDRVEERRIPGDGREEDDEVLPREHPRERALPRAERLQKLEVALHPRSRLEPLPRREPITAGDERGERRLVLAGEEGDERVDLRAIRRGVDARRARRGAGPHLPREARRRGGRRRERAGTGPEPEEP